MRELWHLLESHAAGAAWNMAVDEALLQTATLRGCPLLRVYSWDRASVSFGYFQKYPAQLAGRYALVRRPTGGGVVYHGEDTTITVVVPPGHALHRLKTNAAYGAIHQAIAAALAMPVVLHLALAGSPRGEYECFQEPVQGDVVEAGGRKIAGGAQRRTKAGLLHQGSIAARLTPRQIAEGFRRQFEATFEAHALTGQERTLAERLTREKYGCSTWNERIT